MDGQDTLKLLSGIELLSSLDERTLGALLADMRPAEFAAGSCLCVEGEEGDRMFVVESGEVSVQKAAADGTSVEVTTLGPGAIAGEMSLLGRMTRSATLVAKTEVKTMVLDHDAFERVMRTHPALSSAMMYWLSRHLRRETSTVARLLSSDIDPRFKVAVFDSKPYMRAILEERAHRDIALHFFEPKLSADTVSLAAGFDAVCIFVNDSADADVVEELHAMGAGMIALRCAGYNNVDIEACRRFEVSVARVPAYSPHAVAEHAVALALTLNRRTHRANNRVREGNFSLSGFVGFDMHGKTVGIVGAGKIGRCAISIFRGFGCRVLAYARHPDEEVARALGFEYVPLERLLAESDIVSLHAPLTPSTCHMIDAETIAKMKPGVMIINTSRGGLIDTQALLDGLKSGHVGHAGLDVYEEESAYFFEDCSEQVMTDDMLARLTTFNNVLVTSHQAFLTREALMGIADVTISNLLEYRGGARGEALANAVASPK